MSQHEAGPADVWTILAIAEHADGGRTLTMRNGNGVTLIENYPADAQFLAVVCPTCRAHIKNGRCPDCGYTIGQETP